MIFYIYDFPSYQGWISTRESSSGEAEMSDTEFMFGFHEYVKVHWQDKDLDGCIHLLQGIIDSKPSIQIHSMEVGCCLVKMSRSQREYVDKVGRLHQYLAKRASKVYLVENNRKICIKE